MKILLVSPCKDPNFKKSKFLMIPQLALHLIAGLTPPEHEVRILEEELETIDLEEDCDLVGISCMTSNATRAYELAGEYRKRGRTVVLGGVHPTLLPDEALQHSDAVVVGEAEGVWEQVVADVQARKVQRVYHQPSPSLERYIGMGNRRNTKKRLFDVVPVMTTRGCPYNCEFCCVHDIFGRRIRHLPVDNVVRDIEESEGKIFIFLDDNIIGDPVYAKQLFQAIKPLKIKWVGQASLSFVKDEQMMRLASQSGCKGLFFGLESVSQTQLKRMRKAIKEVGKIGEAVQKIKDFGIYFHASMIFGFDSDTKDTFADTLDFLEKNHISSASINVLTPYPGTEVFRSFKEQGRLLTEDWRYYDHSTVVFQPKNMNPFELQAGRLWAMKQFTQMSSLLRRLPDHLDFPLLHLAMNLGFQAACKHELRELPELAARLFPVPESELSEQRGIPLRSLRLTDLMARGLLRADRSTGN
ncbi:MAG: B12-binding domain-containing radical SAM protein [Spirochaetaceae bacterium]|nr:MAG: B12-binding domain-containing radical SAM protein [Spirochaetaceae bacterium]